MYAVRLWSWQPVDNSNNSSIDLISNYTVILLQDIRLIARLTQQTAQSSLVYLVIMREQWVCGLSWKIDLIVVSSVLVKTVFYFFKQQLIQYRSNLN